MLSRLGVIVTPLPYELHPGIPPEGLSFEQRWAGALEEAVAMYERVAAECRAAGLAFSRPARIPNTRRALETAAGVRQRAPERFAALDRSLFEAHFVEGRFLGDQAVLDDLVAAAGLDPGEVRDAVDAGALRDAVDSSMALAAGVGVTGTPAWLVGGQVLLEGVRPRAAYGRLVARLGGG